MAIITPTLTVRSNASTATSNAGPLSVALSLSGSDLLTVDNASSKIVTVGTTATLLYDGSIMSGTETATEGAGGTYGGFLYFKNITASGSNLIYLGLGSDATTASGEDLELANQDDVYPDANDEGAIRFMTLKRGEFAWVPFDYTYNWFVEANAASQKLECWHFNRSAS
jgi:hypothetical protein